MRRVFWVALGATAGVVVVRRLTRTAERFTPAGISQSLSGGLSGLTDAIREFTSEVRIGMAERESELREALGVDGRHDVTDAHTLGGADAHAMEVAASPYSLEPHRDRPGGLGR